MATETDESSAESALRRRAEDATALRFGKAEINSLVPVHPSFAEAEIETIDMDVVLPHGGGHDFHEETPLAAVAKSPLTPEQKKQRLQLGVFKQTFEDFGVVGKVSRIGIADIKRGDIVEIRTIVGKIYLRIVDRIRGEREGIGQVLCECHYDLSDKGCVSHAASIQLPFCANSFVITHPDGSKRQACRKLKMSTATELPPHVANLLSERFFLDMTIYVNPKPERLRPVDLFRWVARAGLKMKAMAAGNKRTGR